MQNQVRLFSQVAAEASVAPEKAMVACFLLNLSREGRSMDEAAVLLRQPRHTVRKIARDWGIGFSDYVAGQPLRMTWRKAKRGLWELRHDGELIAVATSDGKGCGGYDAAHVSHDLAAVGSSAGIAMARLSALIEQRSLDLFSVDDVSIWIDDDGHLDILAPKVAEDPHKLRQALAA